MPATAIGDRTTGLTRTALAFFLLMLWPLPAAADIVPMVFFKFRESSLSEPAVEVLHEAMLIYREGHYAKLIVTGFCDTAEMVKDCPALAQRRADAAKNALMRLGIDESRIDTGVSVELLVPTGPDVREPQNRRVVVDFLR